jgi:hypothetical protein
MIHLKQEGKPNCGQLAVAMLTERPLAEITQLVAHEHGTKTRELIAALRALGYRCGDRCQRKPVDFGLAQVHQGKKHFWHWIAIGDGCVWDGLLDASLIIDLYKCLMEARGWRITSYLVVENLRQK